MDGARHERPAEMTISLNEQPGAQTASSRWQAVLVALITAGVYLPTCAFSLTNWDDPHYTADNPYVHRPGADSLVHIWTRVRDPVPVESGYYQPLTLTSLMVDAWLAGGRAPRQVLHFHLSNTILHAINAMLVCMLTTRLVSSRPAGVVAGLLFGLHPFGVESVAWVASRKTVLAGAFALLSLLAYTRYAQRNQRKFYWLSLAAFVISLTAKPLAISLAAILLLLDYWPFRSLSWRRVAEKLPFLLIGIGWGALAAFIQARHFPLEVTSDVRSAPLEIGHQLWIYAKRVVWPRPLYPFYPIPAAWDWRDTSHWLPVAGALAAIVLIVRLRAIRPLLVSVGIFLVALAPALGLVKHTSVIAADRFAYLALIGPVLGVAAIIARVHARIGERARWIIDAPVFAGVALMTAFVTLPQQRIWRDSESLWAHVLRYETDSATPHCMYANALVETGRPEQALSHYARAIELRPDYANAHLNLSITLRQLGRLRDAEQHARRSVEFQPSAKSHAAVGQILLDQRRLDAAQDAFRAGLELDPGDFDARFGLATALQAAGQHEDAIREYDLAGRDRPNDLGVLNNTAQSLLALGRLEEAAELLAKADRLAPEHPVIRGSLRDLEAARTRRVRP